MQKWLLLGCALTALTVTAGTANAQDFKVTISGDARFQATFGSQDRDGNSRNTDFRNRFRLVVNPEATALNGALTYGASLRLRAQDSSSTTNFDRAYTYASGAFGTVIAGTHTTFNDDIGAVTTPEDWRPESNVALAFVGASKDNYGTGIGSLDAWRWDTLSATGNNTKLRYQTPVIAGFQLGVSYTPSSTSLADGSSASNWSFRRTKAGLNDVYEVGMLFDSTDKSIADKFGAALLRASVDYQGGKQKSDALVAQKDLSALQAGVQVGYAGFSVGGGLVYLGKSGLSKSDSSTVNAYTWRAGAQYKTGPWVFGVGYDYSQKDVDFDSSSVHAGDNGDKKKAEQFSAGLNYTVAKGLDVSGEYAYVKTKNTLSNLDDKANVVTLSTVLRF